jgi:hypothetical protein
METIAIGLAGLAGTAGAIACVIAWKRGASIPPALAVAAVALPAAVGLLAAQLAVVAAGAAANAPALATVAPHLVTALFCRELAFYAALVPALCLSIGGIAALRARELRAGPWLRGVLVFAPVFLLPLVHGIVRDQMDYALLRVVAYLLLIVIGAAVSATAAESHVDARVVIVVAGALVVAVGEAAALAVHVMALMQDLAQIGAVTRGILDVAIRDINSGLVWLTLTAAWAGVAAIVTVVRTAGPVTARRRALVALLWLAPVPLAFLAGDVAGVLLTVV